MCFNWKVIAGLSAVGVGVWVVAPNLIGVALPLLLVLACPISMFFMMRGMGGGQCATRPAGALRAEQQAALAGLTRDEQLVELKAQLAKLQGQQQAIASEIGGLEATNIAADNGHEVVSPTNNGRLQSRA